MHKEELDHTSVLFGLGLIDVMFNKTTEVENQP